MKFHIQLLFGILLVLSEEFFKPFGKAARPFEELFKPFFGGVLGSSLGIFLGICGYFGGILGVFCWYSGVFG